MFSLKNFVVKTLNGMVGNYPEFQVREYALNWYAKGVLTDEELILIEEWYAPVDDKCSTDGEGLATEITENLDIINEDESNVNEEQHIT